MSEFILLVSSFAASVTLYVQVRFYKKIVLVQGPRPTFSPLPASLYKSNGNSLGYDCNE